MSSRLPTVHPLEAFPLDNPSREAPSLPSYQTIPMAFLAPPPVEHEIDMLEFWKMFIRAKWFILLVTVLTTAGSVYLAKTATPIYRAEVLIAAVDDKGGQALSGGLSGLASMAGLDIGGGRTASSNLAILKSRHFLENFIEEEKLLDVLLPLGPDSSPPEKKENGERERTRLWHAVVAFEGILSVSTERKDGVIAVAIEWHNREQAALWANLLIERLNDHLRRVAIEESEKSVAFLHSELAKTQVMQLQQVLANLLETQIQKTMMSRVRPDFAFNIVDPAVAPPEGVIARPRRKWMVAVGFGAGLGSGLFLALLAHLLRGRKTPE
ncbi:MAG: hypothetical protein HQL76_05210 [Magnetococcales bacterium]|nr:hypothetical protein [Magnetococcales bacterium]